MQYSVNYNNRDGNTTAVYSYDHNGNLTYVDQTGGTRPRDISFTSDASGRVLERTEASSSATCSSGQHKPFLDLQWLCDPNGSSLDAIIPPGWSGNGTLFNEARGHLLGRQLGGSGDMVENLVTLQQNPANSPFMRGFENQVRGVVESGQAVRYSSTPIYNGTNLVPRGITLNGKGSGGFDLYVTILNPPGR